MLTTILSTSLILSLMVGISLWIWHNVILSYKYRKFPSMDHPNLLLGHIWKIYREVKSDEPNILIKHYISKMSASSPASPIFRFHLFWRPVLLVHSPEKVQELLIKTNYPKDYITRKVGAILGDGLLFSAGDRWLTHRKSLQTLFSPTSLRKYVPAFNQHATRLADRLSSQINQPVDLVDELVRVTFEIISEIAFNLRMESGTRVARATQEIIKNSQSPLFHILPYSEVFYKWKTRAARKVITHAVQEVLNQNVEDDEDNPNGCLLRQMKKDNFTLEEISDELVTFFFAGHETTASTLTWFFYEVCRNREIYRKVTDEIDSVLQGRECTYDDLPNLKYLTSAIKETLRLYPALAYLMRESNDESPEIPPGTTIFFVLRELQQRSWTDPEKFDPERFMNFTPSVTSWFPFGLGPRSCIGRDFFWLEAKIILVKIFQQYTIQLLPGPPVVVTGKSGAPRPKDKIYVKVTPRQ